MAQSNHHGQFVWYELMTTDPTAAQTFYTDIAGWGTAPFEGAPVPYTMWMKGETPVGGVVEIPAEVRARGVPPHWLGHVGVDDVDETASRAKKLGASIMMGPETIPEVGRVVVFTDAQGAEFGAFKSAQEMATDDGEPEIGDISWRELGTTDHEAAFEFYSDLFGWEKDQAIDMGDSGVYQMYSRAGRMLGGMYNNKCAGQPTEKSSPKVAAASAAWSPNPPAWLYYIQIGDLDATVRKVKAKGGKIVVEPMEVPGGSRIAVGSDPQGAAFGLVQSA